MLVREELFVGDSQDLLWIEGVSDFADSKMLLTISGPSGDRSALISNGVIKYIDVNDFLEAKEQPVGAPRKEKLVALRKGLHYAGYAFAITMLLFSAFSFSGNVKARIVLTGSMAPAISTGDIIITTPITRKAPKVGDVIAYDAKRFNGEKVAIFSHRIIGGDIKSGFIVKGDANKSPDPQKPTSQDILGVVIFVIPVIGKFLTMKALFLIIPSIFGFWLILNAMKNVE